MRISSVPKFRSNTSATPRVYVYLLVLQRPRVGLDLREGKGGSPSLGLPLQHVDQGVFQQRGEDEAETRRHPDVDGLHV